MIKRPKLIIGILWFIVGGLNIVLHIMEYNREDVRPTGIYLAKGMLNIITGMFLLMSDRLDRKREALRESDDSELIDDFDLEGFEPDADSDVDICEGDCADCAEGC